MENTYVESIRVFFKKHSRMPSYQELSTLFGFESKNASFRVAKKLIEEGFLKKDRTGKLIPGQLFEGLRILGLVEAGFPTPAEESLLETTKLDEWLVDKPEATFMLRVKGDSMIDAGIQEGDMVIVERVIEAKPGTIVIADIDGAWTMKYLRKQGTYFYLEAANKKYKPIFPKEKLEIAAVVKAVVRKY